MTIRLALFVVAAVLLGAVGLSGGIAVADDDQAAKRAALVAEVRRDDRRISRQLGRAPMSESVFEALGRVPRHELVPRALLGSAYDDRPLPIGHDQTISQPYVVALMTDLLRIGPGDTVLEVGTGSGYQAAMLAEMGAVVHTIEIVRPLARRARRDLRDLGYDSVTVHEGDGYAGLPDLAPFDAIIVTAAPDHVPRPLIDQLGPGGRLVLPVGPMGGTQQLILITRDREGELTTEQVIPVRFVPLVRDAR